MSDKDDIVPITKLVELLTQNGKDGTLLQTDKITIALNIDNKTDEQTVSITLMNDTIHLGVEAYFDCAGVNIICDLLRKRQSELPRKDGDVIGSDDERIHNGIHIINSTHLSVTDLHADKKHIGLFVSNETVQQGMMFGLSKQTILELIQLLQLKLSQFG
jgi:hypothetical protein